MMQLFDTVGPRAPEVHVCVCVKRIRKAIISQLRNKDNIFLN